MRHVLLFALLLAAYAATLGVDAAPGRQYAGDEPHFLLTAESIVSDGDADVTDQYGDRAYRAWYPGRLRPDGVPTRGRLHEPHGVGFSLLIAPAYALGGPRVVELTLAGIAALAFVFAAALARRLVPEPWATGGAALAGLSPPALAYATAVSPELTAGAVLAGAALCAVNVRERPRLRYVVGGAALVAALPWLGTVYALPGLPVGVALVAWALRARRRLAALIAAEAVLGSLVFYASINDVLYGGPLPSAAALPGTEPGRLGGYLDRVPRLIGLWLDRSYGLLRWAPVLALAGLAVWRLYRSRRDHLSRLAPARADAEACAALLLALCGVQALVAAFGATAVEGPWFAGRHLVAALPALAALTAWGLRFAPRRQAAALGGLTLAGSAWLAVAAESWAVPGTRAPWGPLERVFPDYATGSVWGAVLAGLVAAGLLAVVGREWRAARTARRNGRLTWAGT